MADWLADIFRAATAPGPSRLGLGFAQPSPFTFPQFGGGGLGAPSMSPMSMSAPTFSLPPSLRQQSSYTVSPAVAALRAKYPGRGQTTGTRASTASGYQPVGQAQVGPGMSANVMKWLPLVEKYAAQQGVPVELALAIMHNESGGNERATSAYNPGSGTAKGLFQTLSLHYKPGEDPYDPETNTRVAMKLLGDSYRRYGGDPYKVMAAHLAAPARSTPRRCPARPARREHLDGRLLRQKIWAYLQSIQHGPQAADTDAGSGWRSCRLARSV